jgi:NTE family protein
MQTRIIRNNYVGSTCSASDQAQAAATRPVWGLAAWVLMALLTMLTGCATRPSLPVGAAPASAPAPAPAEPVAKRPPRVGLALGGGAAKGFAHVGVIAVLEEAGLRPAYVVGTSAGSVVGALYASGKTGVQLQQAALQIEEVALADWMVPIVNRGLFRGEALARYVNEAVGSRLLEDMRIPFGVVATDLGNGQAVLFRRGDTGSAVRASSAVPGVFQPVRISGRDYVDGGLVAPVPVQFARQMGAELVIAVDISDPPEGQAADGTFQILLQTFNIMGKSINQHELKQADLVVRPSLLGLRSADFSARQKAIESGRAAMLAAMPALRARMEALAQ